MSSAVGPDSVRMATREEWHASWLVERDRRITAESRLEYLAATLARIRNGAESNPPWAIANIANNALSTYEAQADRSAANNKSGAD